MKDKIKEAFEGQQSRALALRDSPLEDRKQRLARLQYWIENNLAAIHEALWADFHKPAMEVNLTEIYPALMEVRQAISQLDDWAYPKKVRSPATFMAAASRIYYEPLGVCLVISPWNYPFILAVGPLISALAAGNTVILKPSEHSPATSDLLSKMAEELYSPEDVTVFKGDAEIAAYLMSLPFDHVFFTGSPAIGKKVMEAASANLTSVTLELGGKSPVIVEASAAIGESAERICWGKYLNAGQTCIAPDYGMVHESLLDPFLRELIFHIQKMYGDSEEQIRESPDYARIINERHFERLVSAIEDARDRGARVIFGGDYDKDQLFIAPTVLVDVPEEAVLMQEEIFGPVFPVRSFSRVEEVIGYVNKKPKPLASYLFGQDESVYEQILRKVSAGALVHNDCVVHFTHPNLPFGGVNNSGIGKAHGHHGFLTFSNEKAVLKQRLPLNKLVYPPYTRVTSGVIKYLTKYF